MITYEDTKFISLNSQYGTSKISNGKYLTSYLSDVSFNLKNILKEEDDILFCHIDIVNAQIPVSFYNLNYSCNILKYIIGTRTANSIIYTLTVTKGNYSLSSLITELKSKFALNNLIITIIFDKPTGKITIYGDKQFTFLSSGSTILEIIGFDSNNIDYSSVANILISEHPINLLGIKKIIVSSTILTTNSISSGPSSCILGVIPVDCPQFGLINFSNSSGRRCLLRTKNVDTIDIQLYDEYGVYINFNNSPWEITLGICITRKYKENINKSFNELTTQIMQKEGELPITNTITNANTNTNEDLDLLMYKKGIDI